MEFEHTDMQTSTDPDSVQVTVLQNIALMEGEIERLKTEFDRKSKEKSELEFEISAKTPEKSPPFLQTASNPLQSPPFSSQNRDSPFMFTYESENFLSDFPSKRANFPPKSTQIASQALTEVCLPGECQFCQVYKSQINALHGQIAQFKRVNVELNGKLQACQREIILLTEGTESEKLPVRSDWMKKFLLAVDIAVESRENAGKKLDKSVQFTGNPGISDLEKMLEVPKFPKHAEKPRSKSPIKTQKVCLTDRKNTENCSEEYLLRPQIIEKWANSFRSPSTSPLSRTFTEGEKKVNVTRSARVDPVEERMRERIKSLMKEKEVVKLMDLQRRK